MYDPIAFYAIYRCYTLRHAHTSILRGDPKKSCITLFFVTVKPNQHMFNTRITHMQMQYCFISLNAAYSCSYSFLRECIKCLVRSCYRIPHPAFSLHTTCPLLSSHISNLISKPSFPNLSLCAPLMLITKLLFVPSPLALVVCPMARGCGVIPRKSPTSPSLV